MNKNRFIDLINQIQKTLVYMKSCGFDPLNCSKESLELVKGWTHDISSKKLKYERLNNLANTIAECKRCELFNNCTNIVFGEGNENAELLFVGEAPGFEEDNTGKPFIGKAGKLLTRIIEAMNFSRNDVYICNIVKCRPPNNRNPNDDEIKKCMFFLKQQISVIKPKIICALGAIASRSLLDNKLPISKLRGKFISLPGIEEIKVMPTYHPAYLLRSPSKKREVWEDMQKIMHILN